MRIFEKNFEKEKEKEFFENFWKDKTNWLKND